VAGIVVVILGAVLFTQHQFSFNGGSRAVMLMLALSPLGLLVGALPALRNRPWLAALGRIFGVLVIAGVAYAIALTQQQEIFIPA